MKKHAAPINPTNRSFARVGRRAFLGGSAVALGLPWLESMRPLHAQEQVATPPVRLLYYMVPNGIVMDQFTPATTGAGYALTPILAPLAAHQNDMLVVSGLEIAPARPDGLGHHAAGVSAFITGAHANKSLTDIRLGISADQVAAQAFGGQTRLPSMQLGIEGGSRAGDCDSGYGCDYARNISWADATTPLPKLTDPRVVFDRIFEGFDPQASQADVARRRERKASVLDLVTTQTESLVTQLGGRDRQKLDQYLTGVRELERRVSSTATISCTPGDAPAGQNGLEFPDHVRAMADLMVAAMTCDATRVFSFMQGNALSRRTYPFIGINRGHHDISHNGGDQESIDQLVQIDTWEMEQVAYLFSRMKEVVEGPDSTLYDNSVIFVSSDISDGNRHNSDNKPIIVGGRGGGFLNTGRHVLFESARGAPREKVSNLLVTTLAAAGVQSALGDSDKPLLTELVA